MNFILKLNLEQRFNAALISSICITLIILTVLSVVFVNKYVNEYANSIWKEYVKVFSDSASFPLIVGSISHSNDVAKSFLSANNVVRTSIVNQKNDVVATAGSDVNCGMIIDKTIIDIIRLETNDYWCFYSPIVQDKYIGYVEMIVSKKEYKEIINKLIFVLFVISLVSSILYSVLISKFSKPFTKTLIDMANVLNLFNKGDHDVRANFTGAPEIIGIRDILNSVLSDVQNSTHNLEQLVDERTYALKLALDNSNSANVYKDQLMSIVSHEMKTPLHAIDGYTQLCIENLTDNIDCSNTESIFLLQKSLNRVNDLTHLIDNILIQAQIAANQFNINYSRFLVFDEIESYCEQLKDFARKSNNVISFDGPKYTICTDQIYFGHIVKNLLSNACKFTSDGKILVSWNISDDFLTIYVSDSGVGVHEDNYEKIFDPWWQVDMTLGRRHGGHGLGLSITRQMLSILGGDISVEANEPIGSVFTVRIPNHTG